MLGGVFSTFSTNAGNCPRPSTEACGTWSDPERVFIDAGGGIDVVTLGEGTSARLLLVTIDGNGTIWERRLSVNSVGNETWTDSRKIAGHASASEPSISDLGFCKIFLAYRGTDGNAHYNRLTAPTDSPTGPCLAKAESCSNQNSDPVLVAEFASPGLGRAYLGEPGLASLYGAFARRGRPPRPLCVQRRHTPVGQDGRSRLPSRPD